MPRRLRKVERANGPRQRFTFRNFPTARKPDIEITVRSGIANRLRAAATVLDTIGISTSSTVQIDGDEWIAAFDLYSQTGLEDPAVVYVIKHKTWTGSDRDIVHEVLHKFVDRLME